MIQTATDVKLRIKAMKEQAGTHSPSIDTIISEIPNLKVDIDACFLSNPYATELFLKFLDTDLIKTNKLRDVLEFYPPQNRDVAKYISQAIKVDYRNIFVGNGAIEIIQAVIHNFTQKRVAIPIPTFSSYYEFPKSDIDVVYFKLDKQNDFKLDPKDYVEFIKENKPERWIFKT
jgi:histidinol-phosphate/aromatic aminotransferase/cobyric acid decarboxylase-like protein